MTQRSRRQILRAATAAGAGLLATGTTRPKRGDVTTFVFVAGASGGSGGGSSDLSLRGHRTVGVELPGHGPSSGQYRLSYQAPQDLAKLAVEPSPMKGITLDDYVEAAVATIRRVARYGPVVAVGGSMGGATLSRVGNEVPDLIDRMVYMSAFCCVELRSVLDYLSTPEGKTSLVLNPAMARGVIGDPEHLGATRINWRTADPEFLAAARAANIAEEGPEADAAFMALLNSLVPDESATIALEDARGRKDTWGRVPRTYIRHALDRTIPLPLQNRMIKEADRLTPANRFDVRTVRTGHFPTGEAWDQIIDILHSLAAR